MPKSSTKDTIHAYGVAELKWSRSRFIPFVCVDAVPDDNTSAARDAEELIHVHDLSLANWNQQGSHSHWQGIGISRPHLCLN